MIGPFSHKAVKARTLMGRLRSDVRGNTMAMMAIAMIPILALAGSAVDTARLYVVKVRLQQACDAGALAGRKAMTDTSTSTPLDSSAAAQAQTFFANNFRSGWFQNTAPVFTPVKTTVGTSAAVANAVNGTASVTVPMAIMGMFGMKSQKLAVTCQAVYDLADTDVMFVLDTTGSMGDNPSGSLSASRSSYTRDDGIQAYYKVEVSGSKIEALRQAVVLFDSTMNENKQKDTIVRYGFAPYSNVVNIGKLLPTSSVSSNLDYWTRKQNGDYVTTNVTKVTGVPQISCVANSRYPASGYNHNIVYYYGSSNTKVSLASTQSAYVTFPASVSWSTSNSGTCTNSSGGISVSRPMWTYAKFPIDVTNYTTLQSVPTPGRLDGSTSKWRGCVELTDTSNATTFDSGSLPSDLDPDVMPNWRPMWPEVVWSQQSKNDVKDESVDEAKSYKALGSFENSDSVTCPMEAQTLQQMTANQVHNYVYANNFRAAGNTYHDYGMSWGLRMLSTIGPFKDSVAPLQGRKPPAQNIVFMTDGAPVSDNDNYQMYGIEGLDGRMANGNSGTEIKDHSARLRVLCDAAKARGITVYMIAFGLALSSDMKYCASPGQAFTASNSQALQDAFASIAKRIAMLRVSK